MDHKTLMNLVIILAAVHLVLSAIVGYMLYSNNISTTNAAIFCVVSVVVNVLILVLAYKCRDENCSSN